MSTILVLSFVIFSAIQPSWQGLIAFKYRKSDYSPDTYPPMPKEMTLADPYPPPSAKDYKMPHQFRPYQEIESPSPPYQWKPEEENVATLAPPPIDGQYASAPVAYTKKPYMAQEIPMEYKEIQMPSFGFYPKEPNPIATPAPAPFYGMEAKSTNPTYPAQYLQPVPRPSDIPKPPAIRPPGTDSMPYPNDGQQSQTIGRYPGMKVTTVRQPAVWAAGADKVKEWLP